MGRWGPNIPWVKKKCKQCGKDMIKDETKMSQTQWNERQFCDRVCQSDAKLKPSKLCLNCSKSIGLRETGRTAREKTLYCSNKCKIDFRSNQFYDFETHKTFARESGFESYNEWEEVSSKGWLPNGIYRNPQRSFKPDDVHNRRNRDGV